LEKIKQYFHHKGGSTRMLSTLGFPLLAAIIGNLTAQIVKVPIHFIRTRKWNWGLLISTGGMPSSHSSTVTALTTAIGMTNGFTSDIFSLSAVFCSVVLYDSCGIRRHAGEHAALLNVLFEDLRNIKKELTSFRMISNETNRKKLKELLGHKPIEVLVGGLLGIVVAMILNRLR
jgi:uncharacterized protein